jgi:hypothetical protein
MPVPLTRFVGRERERAEVARLVAENRFVTLVGAGGVGKTRLAIEVAAGLAASFGDGTDLIDLSAVTDPALLPGAVARGLGLEERAGTGLEERMLRVLRGQCQPPTLWLASRAAAGGQAAIRTSGTPFPRSAVPAPGANLAPWPPSWCSETCPA